MRSKTHHSLSDLAKRLGRDRKTLGIVVLMADIPHVIVGTSVVIDGDGLAMLRAALKGYDAKVKKLRWQFAVAR